jgi:hypothetical protein
LTSGANNATSSALLFDGARDFVPIQAAQPRSTLHPDQSFKQGHTPNAPVWAMGTSFGANGCRILEALGNFSI